MSPITAASVDSLLRDAYSLQEGIATTIAASIHDGRIAQAQELIGALDYLRITVNNLDRIANPKR